MYYSAFDAATIMGPPHVGLSYEFMFAFFMCKEFYNCVSAGVFSAIFMLWSMCTF